jgi:two-component system chemotaxis response regulator CheB
MRMKEKKIKVLIVDDSKVMQQILTQLFSLDPKIEVVGTAADPFIARDLIKETRPDVLTLDIEMPKMDGITFLKNLMRLHPMPVVMVSSFTEKGSRITLEALATGAIDYIQKPTLEELNTTLYASKLIKIVKNASRANVYSPLLKMVDANNNSEFIPIQPDHLNQYIIGIGASTGGIQAIETLLSKLPANMPGIVIAQHIQKDFNASLVQRLNKQYRAIVIEGREGLEIKAGHIIIAPGGTHLEIKKKNGKFICHLNHSQKVNGHRPSIDVLFNSLAKSAGSKSFAVLLTGMGKDGACGMVTVKEAGGATIAQDKKSSVVWGMPGYAAELNAANKILPIEDISPYLIHELQQKIKIDIEKLEKSFNHENTTK